MHGGIAKCNSRSQSSDIYTHRLESSAILNDSIHLGYLTKNFIFNLLDFYFLLLIIFFLLMIEIESYILRISISSIKSYSIVRNYSLYYLPIYIYIYMHKKPNIRERASENCETDTERENESTSGTKCFNPITR